MTDNLFDKIKENKIVLQIPCQISKISTKLDKTLKLEIYTTKELNTATEAGIMELRQREGWMLFKENQWQPEDKIPDLPEVENTKSQSKRLRSILYILWEKAIKGKQNVTFNQYYDTIMDRLCEKYKEKIPQE